MTDEGTGPRSADVVPLPGAQPLPEPQPPTRTRGLHGLATSALAICAFIGIGLTFALITVNWTPEARRVVIVILVLTTVAFMASAMTAVFAGARATYPQRNEVAPKE